MNKPLKILFVAQSLKIGGIERALVDQLNSMDSLKYSIDLLLFSQTGEYLKELKYQIRLINSNWFLNIVGKTQAESKNNICYFYLRAFFAVIAKIIGSKRLYNFLFKFMRNRGEYDVAVSYVHDGSLKGLYYGCNSFVLNKVIARKKIAWIHSDYIGVGMNCKERDELYSQFDNVVNVSQAMKDKFDTLKIVPEVKTKVVYNRIDYERIISRSIEKLNIEIDSDKQFKIVSVCRIEDMKGVMQLCEVAKRLRERKCCFKWFFIGKGNRLDECKRYVNENGLNDYMVFTGALSNPYPYIKVANVFVSGSLSETFGLSLFEAVVLNTVVVAKRYDAIDEVLNDTNGIVVDSFDEIFERIYQLYSDKDFFNEKKHNVHPLMDYNKLNIEQLEQLLN